MAADHEAIHILRRAILEHIRDLVVDLAHWADQLERLDSGDDVSDLLFSMGNEAAEDDLAGMTDKRKQLLSDFLVPEGPPAHD
jgi:hypothetical protein